MANKLNIDLEKGDLVLLDGEQYQGTEKQRIVEVSGGFGMKSFTINCIDSSDRSRHHICHGKRDSRVIFYKGWGRNVATFLSHIC